MGAALQLCQRDKRRKVSGCGGRAYRGWIIVQPRQRGRQDCVWGVTAGSAGATPSRVLLRCTASANSRRWKKKKKKNQSDLVPPAHSARWLLDPLTSPSFPLFSATARCPAHLTPRQVHHESVLRDHDHDHNRVSHCRPTESSGCRLALSAPPRNVATHRPAPPTHR